eukprot:749634-Pelagomonas_calceolata.AAC.1
MKSHGFCISLQRSACCRCAASNCCTGLVSSQYLISLQVHMPLACIQLVWLSNAGGWPIARDSVPTYVCLCVPALAEAKRMRAGRRRRCEFGLIEDNQYSIRDIEVVLRQPIIISYVCQSIYSPESKKKKRKVYAGHRPRALRKGLRAYKGYKGYKGKKASVKTFDC